MKYFILLLLFPHVYGQETVRVQEDIVVYSPIEVACEFISNPLNDHLWRSEVNSITQDGDVFTEDAWIGIRKNFITITRLEESRCPEYSLFITIPENPYYLSSHRSFTAIDEHSTLFTYTVDFDERMIKKTFGFEAKPQVVRKLYAILMRKYLRKLAFTSLSW